MVSRDTSLIATGAVVKRSGLAYCICGTIEHFRADSDYARHEKIIAYISGLDSDWRCAVISKCGRQRSNGIYGTTDCVSRGYIELRR